LESGDPDAGIVLGPAGLGAFVGVERALGVLDGCRRVALVRLVVE
jgi:hypothetical protein